MESIPTLEIAFMKIRSVLPLAVFALITCDVSAQVFTQWSVASGGNDHWYAITTSGGTWAEMEAVGVSYGGHLVSIGSAGEQAFLEDAFGATIHSTVLWIGLFDQGVVDTFAWSDGSPVTYTNWGLGEPSLVGSSGDWVVMYGIPVGWDDVFGDLSHRGIIETAVNPVPEPSTYALAGVALLAWAACRRFCSQ